MSAITRPTDMRLHWDAATGWVLDVQALMPAVALASVIAWSMPRQIDRWRALPAGSKKDELARAIELLRAGRIEQRVVGARRTGRGDLVLFKGGA